MMASPSASAVYLTYCTKWDGYAKAYMRKTLSTTLAEAYELVIRRVGGIGNYLGVETIVI